MRDDDIDTNDAPEITDFSCAIRGRFYRPLKQQITLRIDADLLEWFRAQGGKYQTRINAALREYVEEHHGLAGKKKDLTPLLFCFVRDVPQYKHASSISAALDPDAFPP